MMKFHSSDSSSRRGSALLIVLGMLSFMIVSAVAFSVYMRMSRAPSSFLRRNIATSDLVKAALARAIEDIDARHDEMAKNSRTYYDSVDFDALVADILRD